MSWEPEIAELRRREAFAEALGGPDKVERQHFFGKMTVRERIDAMADKGSFHEIGKTAGVAEYDDHGQLVHLTPSNFIFGLARIDDRPVVLSGDDFTVRGGSSDATIPEKRNAAESMAYEMRLPHIRLVDGMGGGGSVKSIEMAGRTYIPELRGWDVIVNHLSVAPSVSLALGSVAGIGAARVATAHYSVIVRDTAQMMIAGPALVEQASLGDHGKEELGHADIHTANGAIDDVVDSEDEAFERARRFLSYLPPNVDEMPERVLTGDSPQRRDEELISIVPREPRRVYKMRSIIESVCDQGSFFEIGSRWGRSIITGLARLDGWPVAIFGEDPYVYGGGWTADSCRKLIRLLDTASTFHLPVVHLADCPGFLIGKESEESGTIRFGSAALAALGQLTAPFACVVIRKAFGVAGAANNKPGARSFRVAWPSGDWGSLPIEGGLEVAYKQDLADSDTPDELLTEIRERLNSVRSPHRSAEFFEIEEIIDPRDTRPVLCEWVDLARRTLRPGPSSFGYRP
ncbi:acyl-CoA carboxylase subunit beta [Candidatus Poriferisodalis sp.]|uniref:acyl-CoA carboxylase subunit beta n=1 Tax=Candidatus Poriferisodalis sp. TaxID=3101277 RepID=UPI003B01D488